MSTKQIIKKPQVPPQQKRAEYGVYTRSMISMKIHLKMSEVGSTTKQNLEKKILQKTEGKCIPEGYVRPDSVELISYSSGVIKMNVIEFQVIFECLICNPVEGMIVECTTKTITEAGIHAEVITGNYLPMKVFVARDHNYANKQFGEIKENMKIKVSIIGKRFELNDPYIVAIAALVRSEEPQFSKKPRIQVLNEPVSEEEVSDEEVEVEPVSIPTMAVPK